MKISKNIGRHLAFIMVFCLVGGSICGAFGLIQSAFAKPNEASIAFDANGKPRGQNLKFFDENTDGKWYPGYSLSKEYLFKNPSSNESLKIEHFGIDNLSLSRGDQALSLEADNLYVRAFLNNMLIHIESKTDKNGQSQFIFKGTFGELQRQNQPLNTVTLKPNEKIYMVYTIQMKEEAGNSVANLSSHFDFSYQLSAFGGSDNQGERPSDGYDNDADRDLDRTPKREIAKKPQVIEIEDEAVALSDGLGNKNIKRIIYGGAKKSQLRLKDALTLPEAVSLLGRAVELKEKAPAKEVFPALKGKWYKNYAEIGAQYGLLDKKALGRLQKSDTLTQGEFTEMLAKIYQGSRPIDEPITLAEAKKQVTGHVVSYYGSAAERKVVSRTAIANMLVDTSITAEFLPTIYRSAYDSKAKIRRAEAFELVYELLIRMPEAAESAVE